MSLSRLLPAALGAVVLIAGAGTARSEEPSRGPRAVSCTTNCHTEEATAYRSDVHAGLLGCVDCHGGDPGAHRDADASHDESKGFLRGFAEGRIRERIPSLCGDCHADPIRMAPYGLPTDQLAHYKVSNHGKALFGHGDTTVAVCTDCHGAHGILAAKDPRAPTAAARQPATCGRCHTDAARMAPYGLATDVVDRFARSVHGKALLEARVRGAPSCADCHGSHGAAPPGVSAVVDVCAHCHTNTGEQFRLSPHFAKADEMRCSSCHEDPAEAGHGWNRGGCTACHDAHEVLEPGDWMYDGDAVGHCGHCHRQSDPGVADAQAAIRQGRADLLEAMAATRREIQDAKDHGIFLETERLDLHESERFLVSVQPLIHSMDATKIRKHLKDGIERQRRTHETLGKMRTVLRDQKILMAGAALILLLLAALFWVKLSEARRPS
jgi:hypothetical protein